MAILIIQTAVQLIAPRKLATSVFRMGVKVIVTLAWPIAIHATIQSPATNVVPPITNSTPAVS